MASTRAKGSALDAALSESPPPPKNGKRSVLDRDDARTELADYLRRRAKGEHVGSFDWFTREVIVARLGIQTCPSNVKRYCETKLPDLYREAIR